MTKWSLKGEKAGEGLEEEGVGEKGRGEEAETSCIFDDFALDGWQKRSRLRLFLHFEVCESHAAFHKIILFHP